MMLHVIPLVIAHALMDGASVLLPPVDGIDLADLLHRLATINGRSSDSRR
jgi:hypothetical protein